MRITPYTFSGEAKRFSMMLPQHSSILDVVVHDGIPKMLVQHSNNHSDEKRHFALMTTAEDMDLKDTSYIGNFPMGRVIYILYEVLQ